MPGPAGPRPPPARAGEEGAAGGAGAGAGTGGVLVSPRRGSTVSSSRRTSMASEGRPVRRGGLVGTQGPLQVFDEDGKNVTPHPLFQSDPNTATPRTYGSSSTWISNKSTTKSGLEGTAEPGSGQDPTLSLSAVQVGQEETEEELTEADLDQRVDIYLSETDTLWMFDMPSVMVSVEAEDAGRVLERNKIYADMCKTKAGSERFEERMVQTLAGAAKNKEVQCETIIMEDKGTMVTSWDLDNSLDASETEPTSQAEGSGATTGGSSKSPTTKEQEQTVSVSSDREPDITSDRGDTATAMEEDEEEEHDKEKKDEGKEGKGLIDPSMTINKTPEEDAAPRLEQLWSYTCDLTSGHSVSSMAWNKVNPDLLAIGYGEFDSKDQKKGLACCWSLKNPMWPERIFQCDHGVTAVDFSLASPNLLAVGTSSGSVAVYDVRSQNNAAFLDSSASLNKHTGAVWQLRWVEQDRGATEGDKKERLMCISADGRVTEWLIQQRLDCIDLMKLRRTEREKKKLPGEKERKSEAPISQQAAGMCFDFHPEDTDIYLAGTDEGHIYQCSCSGKEQILGTYRGHKGPVYRVAWNPSSTDMFLSCSADWSTILWHRDSQTPLLTFSSVRAFVHDIMWSPKSAFIFAAVKESRVEIWDLSVSIFNPVISHAANPEANLTSILFAKNTNCLLLGDSLGGVGVWELFNLDAPGSNKVGTLHDIVCPVGAV
ncbi:dynein axonemal intermediate chain 4 isoform X3 [Manacus candei]|uniref:dynein axonemal intermediate chain 4 isoform X3 n=1 Tax=Manacus candei TaxID=415023 RepID=UPI0022274405|nr:dynein axonemal intermediate chain 4 isoform X3 [Manacus candei]